MRNAKLKRIVEIWGTESLRDHRGCSLQGRKGFKKGVTRVKDTASDIQRTILVQ